MMKFDKLKVLGVATTIVGIGVNILASVVSEKQLDEKIAEKTAEAVANLVKKD